MWITIFFYESIEKAHAWKVIVSRPVTQQTLLENIQRKFYCTGRYSLVYDRVKVKLVFSLN